MRRAKSCAECPCPIVTFSPNLHACFLLCCSAVLLLPLSHASLSNDQMLAGVPEPSYIDASACLQKVAGGAAAPLSSLRMPDPTLPRIG